MHEVQPMAVRGDGYMRLRCLFGHHWGEYYCGRCGKVNQATINLWLRLYRLEHEICAVRKRRVGSHD